MFNFYLKISVVNDFFLVLIIQMLVFFGRNLYKPFL